jgi:hypothetical protein
MSPKAAAISPEQRKAVYHRDSWRCRRCSRTADLNIHHRKLRSQGGTNDPENLVTLCGSGTTGCHGWAHGHPQMARVLGWIVPSWADPAAWPIRIAESHWAQPRAHWWDRLATGTDWQMWELALLEGSVTDG